MAVINIGDTAENLGSHEWSKTVVEGNFPADGTGTIDEIKLWCSTDLQDPVVGLFTASGNNLTSQDYESLSGPIADDQVITLNAPGDFTALDVNQGEYLGIDFSGGAMRVNLSGGSNGMWRYTGDFPYSSQAFTFKSGYRVAIEGSGETTGGTLLPILLNAAKPTRVIQ